MDNVAAAPDIGAEGVNWDLGDLYKSLDDPAIERDLDEADSRVDKLVEQYRGKIALLSAAGEKRGKEGFYSLLYLISFSANSASLREIIDSDFVIS